MSQAYYIAYTTGIGPNIGPAKKDGTQYISLYDRKLNGRRTYNVPEENIDKYIETLNKNDKTFAKTSLLSLIPGGIIGLMIGKKIKDKSILCAGIGASITGAIGFFIAYFQALNNNQKAKKDYIEDSQVA